MSRTRAYTRAQYERLKARVAHYWAYGDKTPRSIGILARTRHGCSCPGCGNERYWEGLTMQERRAEAAWHDALADLEAA